MCDNTKVPDNEECEICPAPATTEHDGLFYCGCCYETDILHQ